VSHRTAAADNLVYAELMMKRNVVKNIVLVALISPACIGVSLWLDHLTGAPKYPGLAAALATGG
jgi:hypothetical protein